ncbi:MAG: NAD(P)/FAD-dependent oxidoreductase [Rhizobiaceae bacterium]|nr:NAD(P)/FAD-dependent oxidoreductase [Rhizobiaceae bacterium]
MIATTRRQFFGLAAGAAALTGSATEAAIAKVQTKARIVILGAGAAGTAAASHLVNRLDGARITIIDPRKEHWYQPGFTLIAAGLKPATYSVSQTADWIPDGVELIAEAASEINAYGRTIVTETGRVVPYDFLIVATGLTLRYDEIKGMSRDLIGKNGIGSVYAGPDAAAATWAEMRRFNEKGGVALFHRPATEMKCAGAPLKYAFLTEDYASKAGTRGNSKFLYYAPQKALFSVPIVAEKVRMLFGERGIEAHFEKTLTAIDAERKVATFKTLEGPEEVAFDFINVIPPMRAPDVIQQSPLPWKDKWKGQGWLEVDPATLRHARFPEVFAVGDVAGVPKGKTAASVKWQVPVAVDHLVATISGTESTATYGGYTSCPLITRVGKAMLVEFDYKDNLVPSFPGVIAPLEELWISWLMKEVALKPTYNAMLRGRA